MKLARLVVIGAGLIGGSVAAAARARGVAQDVWVMDPAQGAKAVSLGFASRSFQDLAALLDAMNASSDVESVMVLASPVPAIAKTIQSLGMRLKEPWFEKSTRLITDSGSTKHALIESVESLESSARALLVSKFVPCHPMAGSERSGPEAASDSLFVSARILVSAFDETPESAVADAESFWLALGGQPTPLPLRDHDAVLAAISHFPHLVSYGLAAMLSRSPMARMAQNLHGGGLRDTTRIAASSPELWAEIMLDNRDAMRELLGHWRLAFDGLSQALEKGDRTALIQGLSEAADWRRQF